jgi:hypothetical protein
MSNGYNTYADNQDVGSDSGTTATMTATGVNASNNAWGGSWSDVVNAPPGNAGQVQIFANTQQLTNNYSTDGQWNGQDVNLPVGSLSALKVNYSESISDRSSSTGVEFSPDVWDDNYCVSSGCSDIMFWTDTAGRCDAGSYGGTVLGTVVIDGQTWTVNSWGKVDVAAGANPEIIFVLDSDPSKPNSCAQQTSGTINIKAGLQWLADNKYLPDLGSLSQLNTGFEVTQAAPNTTLNLKSYSVTATP